MTKVRAIAKAALVKAKINTLERLLLDGVEMATEAQRGDVADKISDAHGHVTTAHGLLSEVAAMLADHYDDDVSTFSGGSADDKEPPAPEEP
jgi:hypothetical protein